MASNWNNRYGHKQALMDYVGRERPEPIGGYLQHGWAPWYEFQSKPFMTAGNLRGVVPKLVWAERDRIQCERHGLWPVDVVGAPFLYLLEAVERDQAGSGTHAGEPGSLVAFPLHTVAGATEHAAEGWRDYADEIAAIEGYERITVCLHPSDHRLPERRALFEERGLATTTNGPMDDPAFARRQLAQLERAEAVTANAVGTALFYAAMLGRRSFVYGKPVGMDLSADTGVEGGNLVAGQLIAADRESFGEFFDGGIEGAAAVEFARGHLGPPQLLAPQELERKLGWRGRRRLGAKALAGAATARRRLKPEKP